MELTTSRMILREFVFEDWPAVLAYQSNPRYLRYTPWDGRSAADVQAFVQCFVDYQKQEPRAKFQLALTLTLDGRLIGTCGLRKAAADSQEAEIGCELAPEFWRQGYAEEALRAVLAFGFDGLKLHRIWASCIAENGAAVRLVETLGLRLEGRFRERTRLKDRWQDELVYAILDREWPPPLLRATDSTAYPRPTSAPSAAP